MSGARLPHAPAYVGGCTVPEPRRPVPLAQRVDVAAIEVWTAANERARAEYRLYPFAYPQGTSTCRHGHPYDAANTYRNGDLRLCRTCRSESSRRYRARKRAART